MNSVVDVDYAHLFFPPTEKKLAMTEIALYSSTPYCSNQRLLSFLKDELKISGKLSELTAIDATGCVGADASGFATVFKHVTVYEPDEVNFSALKHNFSALGLSADLRNEAIDLKKSEKLGADFIYFDPPWGGKDYKADKATRLMLGGSDIFDIVRRVKATLVVVKVPHNADLSSAKGLKFKKVSLKKFSYLFIQC